MGARGNDIGGWFLTYIVTLSHLQNKEIDKNDVLFAVTHDTGVPIESLEDVKMHDAVMAVAHIDLEATKH